MIGALQYNEKKVVAGTARCISSNQSGLLESEMSLAMKLNLFRTYTLRNRKSKTNVVHISLNFHPKENLSDKTLSEIAHAYMNKIGFESQPFFVYAHHDAAHPHLHIVSTSIREDGKRIPLHNIGKTLSENARVAVEQEFRLIKATQCKIEAKPVHFGNLKPVQYGTSQTKESLRQVVDAVIRGYKFSSLYQFNAVLRRYNITAIEGSEGSLLRQRSGLLYSVLDKDGAAVGVPVKASAFPGRPTLKKLQKLFELNQVLRATHKPGLVRRIDTVLSTHPRNLDEFSAKLGKLEVYTTLRRNDEGSVYGLTFIDQASGCVFNGSELGKTYSAAGIIQRMASTQQGDAHESNSLIDLRATSPSDDSQKQSDVNSLLARVGAILSDLAKAEQLDHSNYNPLLSKRRKRRRKSI